MPTTTPIPSDVLTRQLTVVEPDSPELSHIGLVGDTYTVLISAKETAGRYCLIDRHIPPGGGPPPHRHDFEESFTVLAGQIEAVFRGKTRTVKAGQTISIPANAPHAFRNKDSAPARLLCICAPAGQEEFFKQVGVPVAGRTTPPPAPNSKQAALQREKAEQLAPQFKTELLPPD